jgi:hypothetical protein
MSDDPKTAKPSDAEIRTEWRRICRLYDRGRPLGQRIALAMADKLEATGVTEAGIDLVMT